jgi:hypothetical protein
MLTSPIIEKMHVLIHSWELQNDRRAIFLNCYAQMTQNMFLAIEMGEFHSGEWVSALLHRFANYYFVALEAYDRARPTSPVWQITFDAAARPDTATIQNLFLGVNAHINYDLILTVYDMLFPEWGNLSHESRRSRYEDHTRVNEIIAGTIDSVQDTVVERYTPAMDLVDRLLGPLDEWMTANMIARWRENVWRQAVRMLESSTELEQANLRGEVEKDALRLAKLIARL